MHTFDHPYMHVHAYNDDMVERDLLVMHQGFVNELSTRVFIVGLA